MGKCVDLEALDLRRWLRPGDAVWCSQGIAEPLALTERLMQQAPAIGGLSVFLGILQSSTFSRVEPGTLGLFGYGGIGTARALVDAGAMDVVPAHYSQIARLVQLGALRCDVVLLQLSPEGPDGRLSLGIAHDHLALLARHARVVIAEINDQVPWTQGSAQALDAIRLTAVIRTSQPLPRPAVAPIGDVERRIAGHAASFIGDRCVVQPGIGSVSDAILEALSDRRDLGIHAGLIGEGVRRLMEQGAVTNAFKETDSGMTTSGLVVGGEELLRFVDRNPAIVLRDPTYTHAMASLSRLSRLVAVNSAVEVDLTGQVNAELAGRSYVGAVGGQGDFIRGALASDEGRSIIALPSMTRGETSRIVTRLAAGTVTTPRCDADVIVTEWGAAQLRGQPLRERMRRMIAIAHPAQRERLERECSCDGAPVTAFLHPPADDLKGPA
jgi:acetyl-CoA hydrolase